MQGGDILFQDDLHQLYQGRNDQDEHHRLEVIQPIGNQQVSVDGQVTAVAMAITKVTATLIPTAESSFLETPRRGRCP